MVALNLNTANIVKEDAAGIFSVGTVTGSLAGECNISQFRQVG
jgi:hypothetical protein